MTPTRILVVEDERVVAEDICSSLDALGFALSAAVTSPPSLGRKAG